MNKKYTNLEDVKNVFYNKFIDSKIEFLNLLDNRWVLVKDKYGIYKYKIDTILYYGTTSIKCAINKTEVFINKSKEIHDKYDYSKTVYKGALKKLEIICLIHGSFNQIANSHLQKNGCPKCGKIKRNISSTKNVKYYTDKLKKIHKNNYTIIKKDYKNLKTPINHFCKIQQEWFKMRPSHVLAGQTCRKCANKKISKNAQKNSIGWSYTKWEEKGLKSKYFDGFKVYIIKCYNEDESFFKVGKTFQTIKKRFQSKKEMPYKWKMVKIFQGNAKEMSELETQIKNNNKMNKYKTKIKFNGNYECFKELQL